MANHFQCELDEGQVTQAESEILSKALEDIGNILSDVKSRVSMDAYELLCENVL